MTTADDDVLIGRDRGDNDAPPAEHQEQPQAQAEPQGQQPEAPADQERDPDSGRHVPLSELKAERKKRQALEDEFRSFRAQFERQPQQQYREPPSPPDPWQDPGAAIQHATQITEARMVERFHRMSEKQAISVHGKEMVAEAEQAAIRAGLTGHFAAQAHPYGDLVEWYQRAKVLHDIGPDPEAYKKKVRSEVIAELNKGSQPQLKFPGTLADATAAAPVSAAPTDGAVTMAGAVARRR